MKILFFSPHSAVWIHAFPEALIAEALKQGGNDIFYVGCGGVLKSHCIPMMAYGLPFEASQSKKERICHLCRANEKIIRSSFGFDGIDLAQFANNEDIAFAAESVAWVTPQNCLDFVSDSVEVGRIALYELLLRTKKGTLDFSEAEWQRYLASLKNVLIVMRLAQRIMREVRPDRVITYNALYSVNRVVCRLAELNGIPQYFLHAGLNLSNRLQTVLLGRGNSYTFYRHMLDKWVHIENKPCPQEMLRPVTDNFLEIIKGRNPWAYSSAPQGGYADLRSFFGIGKNRKVICATMSSHDEIFAAEVIGAFSSGTQLTFPSQVDWIKALIDFVLDRDDLHLIIRVHPREFPNKREKKLSDHARMLKDILSTLPENVRVNWPTDDISLYDLAEIADVFANAWSSAGKEMAMLGLPVVLYSDALVCYPSDLNYLGRDKQEYFQQLEKALRDGWNPEWIRKVYRWSAMEFGYSFLDIAESYSKRENLSGFSKGISKLSQYVAPYREQKIDCRNRVKRLSSYDQINLVLSNKLNSILDIDKQDISVSYSEETNFLKIEVRRLVEGLYGANGKSRSSSLESKLCNFANST